MKKTTKRQRSAKTHQLSTPEGARLLLGGYLLVFLLCQLFTFEKFPTLLESIGLGAMATAAAIILVVSQLLAMPSLIGLRVPTRVKKASAVSVFGAMLVLTGLEIAAFTVERTVLFGATLDLPGGAWSLWLLAALWALLLWVTFSKSK